MIWQLHALSWIPTSLEEKSTEGRRLRLGGYSRLETCRCEHPGNAKSGKNGYSCIDDKLNGFCPQGLPCFAKKTNKWNYGDFPCGSGVSCECLHAGNVNQNGFQCSDQKYNGRCNTGHACLTSIGHVWPVETPPCGPMSHMPRWRASHHHHHSAIHLPAVWSSVFVI